MSNLIELNSVTKTYSDGDRQIVALASVDLEISAGTIVGVAGRSGSGKSTLLNLIGAIDNPTRGEVRVEGHNLADMTDKQRTLFRRDRVGFIFQSFHLLPTLTALENVMIPLRLRGLQPADARDEADRLLTEIGLHRRGLSLPAELSGGEQQRIAIARAMAHNPALVLADEPTGNLDSETSTIVLDLLEQMARDRNKTVVIATHSQQTLDRTDRIVSLADGMITEDRKKIEQ